MLLTKREINTYIQSRIKATQIPGLAIGIVERNQIIYLQGFGKADSSGQLVTPQTPFILGSLSKSFTAMAVMQLVEGGKIDLDVPMRHYLPWFQVADPTASVALTARHFLSHTSGISRFTGRELLGQSENEGIEQRVRALRHLKLKRPLGVFQYSNTNYLVLGLLIESISGERYGDYIQRHIFEQLGMQHSHVSEHEAVADGLATGYRWMFGFPVPGHTPYLSDALPAAFLISSAEDMSKYLLACLDAGASSDALLSPDGFAELYRPQVSIPGKKSSSYALGWRTEHVGNVQVIRHSGEVADFRSEILMIPEQELGIVVLVNCNNGAIAQAGLDHIAPGVMQLLLALRPTETKITFRQFYGMLNLAILTLSSLQLWSILRLLRPGHTSRWNTIAMLSDVVAPLLVWWGLPKLTDSPWSLLRYYVPDVFAWLTGMGILSLIKSTLRAVRAKY